MKDNDFLENILKKIGAQIPCPKCRKVFKDANIELVSFKGQDMKLKTTCPHCSASISIGANVKSADNKPTKSNPTRIIPSTMKTKNWLSPDGVRNIAHSVRSFSGTDVRQLLS